MKNIRKKYICLLALFIPYLINSKIETKAMVNKVPPVKPPTQHTTNQPPPKPPLNKHVERVKNPYFNHPGKYGVRRHKPLSNGSSPLVNDITHLSGTGISEKSVGSKVKLGASSIIPSGDSNPKMKNIDLALEGLVNIAGLSNEDISNAAARTNVDPPRKLSIRHHSSSIVYGNPRRERLELAPLLLELDDIDKMLRTRPAQTSGGEYNTLMSAKMSSLLDDLTIIDILLQNRNLRVNQNTNNQQQNKR